MKRRSFFIAALAVVFLAAATVHAAQVGTVSALQGRVDITAPGGKAVALKSGDTVSEGDIVRTKSRSKVAITFEDGSIIRLAAKSRVRIDSYTMGKGEDRGILKLFRGKIQSIVKKSKGLFGFNRKNRFEVHTPTAVCGVRGTNYFSSYQGGTSNFVFKEGSGYGYSLNKPEEVMLISAGQAMSLAGAEAQPVLRPATDAELKQHSEDTDAGEPEGEEKGDAVAEDGDNPSVEEAADEASAEEGQSEEKASEDGEKSDGGPEGAGDEQASETAPEEGPADHRGSPDGGEEDGPEKPGDDGPVAAGDPQGQRPESGGADEMRAEGEPGGETGAEAAMVADAGPAEQGRDEGGPGDAGYGDKGPVGAMMGGEAAAGDPGTEGGMNGDAGSSGYGPQDNAMGPGDSKDPGGMYGDAAPGGYGPEGGGYGDAGATGGMYGDAAGGDFRSDGGTYADDGPSLMGPGDGMSLDGGYADTRSGGDDPVYLANNDMGIAGDYGSGLIPAGDDPGYFAGDGGYDPGNMPTDGYIPMDVPVDMMLMPDAGLYPDNFDPGYYPLDPYMAPEDLYYEPPPWDSTEYVPELEVFHEIRPDANNKPEIRLWGTFDPVMMHPPAFGIEALEGSLDNSQFFLGTIGGVWYGGSVEGDLLALYIGTGGDAGILRTDWNGTYAADNSWSAGWTPLTLIEMAASGVSFDANNPVPEPTPVYYDDHNGLTFAAGSGTITLFNRQDEVMGVYMGFAGQDWGVWRGGVWGAYTGTPDSNWIMAIESNAFGGRDMHLWMEHIGDQWAGGQIFGKSVGAWVDLTEATTGILGGKIHGVYDPSDPENMWDAVAGGVSLETSRFLAMVNGTTAEKALVAQLGLPSFEVGSATLTGSDAVMSVNMNNVTFFSFATGGAPRVWATDDVAGAFSAVPAELHTVGLSGGGLSADFMVRAWKNGKWAAEVTSNGTNTLVRTDTAGTVDLSFVGGAGGTYTGGGAFSGTAAGVAKPITGAAP